MSRWSRLWTVRVSNKRHDPATSTSIVAVGKASSLEKHVPVLYQDLRGGSLDVWVQHTGGKWLVFATHPEGEARTCQVTWSAKTETFTDPCTHATYPADGGNLQHFPTAVDKDGTVMVDFTR